MPVRADLNAKSARRGGPSLRLVYRRPPCVPRSREREKRPAAETETVADVQKKNIWHIYNCSLLIVYVRSWYILSITHTRYTAVLHNVAVDGMMLTYWCECAVLGLFSPVFRRGSWGLGDPMNEKHRLAPHRPALVTARARKAESGKREPKRGAISVNILPGNTSWAG